MQRSIEATRKVLDINLMTQLHADEHLEVDHALDTKLPLSDILCVVNAFTLTRKDLITLSPNTWLNDEIMNSILHILSVRAAATRAVTSSPKICILNTFFFALLSSAPAAAAFHYNYAAVSRVTKTLQKNCDYDIIIIPIHVNGNHWAIAVIYVCEHRILYFDSLVKNDGAPVLKLLERFVIDAEIHKSRVGASAVERSHGHHIGWTLENGRVAQGGLLPKQTNLFDCGVFALMVASSIASQTIMGFSHRDIPVVRRRLAAILLRWSDDHHVLLS